MANVINYIWLKNGPRSFQSTQISNNPTTPAPSTDLSWVLFDILAECAFMVELLNGFLTASIPTDTSWRTLASCLCACPCRQQLGMCVKNLMLSTRTRAYTLNPGPRRIPFSCPSCPRRSNCPGCQSSTNPATR